MYHRSLYEHFLFPCTNFVPLHKFCLIWIIFCSWFPANPKNKNNNKASFRTFEHSSQSKNAVNFRLFLKFLCICTVRRIQFCFKFLFISLHSLESTILKLRIKIKSLAKITWFVYKQSSLLIRDWLIPEKNTNYRVLHKFWPGKKGQWWCQQFLCWITTWLNIKMIQDTFFIPYLSCIYA